MKKSKGISDYKTRTRIEVLLHEVDYFLQADLEDPRVERGARELLTVLRIKGADVDDPDLDDPDCLSCLFQALLSAADYGERIGITTASDPSVLH
jgi:hypothetical protein